MAIRTDAQKNALAAAYAAGAVWVSLHSADPGTTGTSELAGGGYARVQTTWGSPASGVVQGSPVVLTIPPGNAVTHVGFWTLGSAGSFRDCVPLAVAAQALPMSVTVTPSYTQT